MVKMQQALLNNNKDSIMKIMLYLQHTGLSVNKKYKDFSGNTLLHSAVEHSNIYAIEQLLQLGADPTLLNNNNKSCIGCIHFDIKEKDVIRMLELLLADRAYRRSEINELLDRAIAHKMNSIIVLLVRCGASIQDTSVIKNKATRSKVEKCIVDRFKRVYYEAKLRQFLLKKVML
jgi:ankyrin repeat protein